MSENILEKIIIKKKLELELYKASNSIESFLKVIELKVENNTFGSIDGATALKLDEKFEVSEENQHSSINNLEQSISEPEKQNLIHEQGAENLPTGVSIESASYIENSNENFTNIETTDNGRLDTGDQEEYTPKLFSDESKLEAENDINEDNETHMDKLFDQDSNEEEDFEIPAFLRKQKF